MVVATPGVQHGWCLQRALDIYASRGPTPSSVGPVLPLDLKLWHLHPCSLVLKESLLATLQSFINIFFARISHHSFLLFATYL